MQQQQRSMYLRLLWQYINSSSFGKFEQVDLLIYLPCACVLEMCLSFRLFTRGICTPGMREFILVSRNLAWKHFSNLIPATFLPQKLWWCETRNRYSNCLLVCKMSIFVAVAVLWWELCHTLLTHRTGSRAIFEKTKRPFYSYSILDRHSHDASQQLSTQQLHVLYSTIFTYPLSPFSCEQNDRRCKNITSAILRMRSVKSVVETMIRQRKIFSQYHQKLLNLYFSTVQHNLLLL